MVSREQDMHVFEVHFTWQSRHYVEYVTCGGLAGAAAAVKAKYPGAHIGSIKLVRK